MDRLEQLRMEYGRPMRLTSAYRCPEHNMQCSSTGPVGPHTTGKAVDVAVSGADAHELLALALHFGFAGVGVKQRGSHKSRFLHLDTLDQGPGRPRPTVWGY